MTAGRAEKHGLYRRANFTHAFFIGAWVVTFKSARSVYVPRVRAKHAPWSSPPGRFAHLV